MTEKNPNTGEQELVITRIFDTLRKLIFKACPDPECVKRRWGTKDFTSSVSKKIIAKEMKNADYLNADYLFV